MKHPPHCRTCTCGPVSGRDVPTSAKAWLLRHGDGVSDPAVMSTMLGVLTKWVPLRVQEVDGAILREVAKLQRSQALSPRLERLRAAGCFKGLRRNGVPFSSPKEFERERRE